MAQKAAGKTTRSTDQPREMGPWDTAWAQLREWDPDWLQE